MSRNKNWNLKVGEEWAPIETEKGGEKVVKQRYT